MKKTMIMLLAVLALVAMFNASAFAGCNANPGESLNVVDLSGNSLDLNFSPAVTGCYFADATGTSGNIQWYAIGTVHAGGEKAYATASSFTSIYKMDVAADATRDASLFAFTKTSASDGAWGTSWKK